MLNLNPSSDLCYGACEVPWHGMTSPDTQKLKVQGNVVESGGGTSGNWGNVGEPGYV